MYVDFDTKALSAIETGNLDTGSMVEMADERYAKGKYGEAVNMDDATRLALLQSRFVDAIEAKSMADALVSLPTPGEAIHAVIGGLHSMGHIIPAILKLAAPAIMEELTICTLTFSKANAIDLAAAMDAGLIRKLTIVASHYFAKTSTGIFDPSAAILRERGATVITPRSHAKLILCRLSDGRFISGEGSANLRSAVTIEQVTLFGDPQVYAFHAGWIRKLIEQEEATHERP